MRLFSVRALTVFSLSAITLAVGCSPVAPSFLKSLAYRSAGRPLDIKAPAPTAAQTALQLRQWTWDLTDTKWETYAGTALSNDALTQLERFGKVQLQWNEDQLSSLQVAVGVTEDATPENPEIPKFAVEQIAATSPRARPTWELRILNHADRKHWAMDKVSLLPDRPLTLKELL